MMTSQSPFSLVRGTFSASDATRQATKFHDHKWIRAEGRRQQTPDRLGTWTRRLPRHFLHLEDGDATERLADRVFYR